MSFWNRFFGWTTGSKGDRSGTSGAGQPGSGAAGRRLSGEFLLSVARSLMPGGGSPQESLVEVPAAQNERELMAIRDRCSTILSVLRLRPKACSPVLAACLRSEGFDEISVRRAVALVAPQADLPRQLLKADRGYLECELRYARSQAYDETVALAEAIACYSPETSLRLALEAKSQAPTRPEALRTLGRLYQECGRPALAAEAYRSLVLDSKREEFRSEWARSLNDAGHPEQALIVINQAPLNTVELSLVRASAHRRLGEVQRALAELNSIPSGSIRDEYEYLVEKGDCEYRLGRFRQAVKTVGPALSARYLRAYRVAGLAYCGDRNWPQAVSALQEFVQSTSDDPEVWRALGEARFALGDYSGAVQAAREARQLAPDGTAAASLLAQSLVAIRQYEEAADLTSETFVQALKGLPNFRRQSQPYTWLYRIAVNLCKNHFRYNAHRARHHAFSLDQGRETDGDDSSIDIEDHRHEPGRLFETLEIQQHVEKAIAALPAEMRMTVVLRDLQGLSYQEIADVLDCSLEAVKSRLFRARAALREQLRPFIQTKDE